MGTGTTEDLLRCVRKGGDRKGRIRVRLRTYGYLPESVTPEQLAEIEERMQALLPEHVFSLLEIQGADDPGGRISRRLKRGAYDP